MLGLSPLARGNRHELELRSVVRGPIPARAGEPSSTSSPKPSSGAYLRSRGGTQKTLISPAAPCGLSPLARGNLQQQDAHLPGQGPIPARAGEPGRPGFRSGAGRAYPRSRGGTAAQSGKLQFVLGLSPLARGNLANLLQRSLTAGPIPARAGEPRHPTRH